MRGMTGRSGVDGRLSVSISDSHSPLLLGRSASLHGDQPRRFRPDHMLLVALLRAVLAIIPHMNPGRCLPHPRPPCPL